MPATGERSHFSACDIVVKLDDLIGNQIVVSPDSNKIEAEFENAIEKYHVFGGKGWPRTMQCVRDSSFKLTGVASTDPVALARMVREWFQLRGGPRTLQFSVPDDAPGSTRFQAEVRLGKFSFNGDASKSEPVLYEIEFMPHGEVVMMDIV